jgi:hypothetical protein
MIKEHKASNKAKELLIAALDPLYFYCGAINPGWYGAQTKREQALLDYIYELEQQE